MEINCIKKWDRHCETSNFLFLVKIKNYIIKLWKNFAIKNLQNLEGDDKNGKNNKI